MRSPLLAAAAMTLALPAMAETHTVSWFLAHRADLSAKMAACRDNPGDAKNDPECENAYQARLSMAADEAQAHANGSAAAWQERIDQETRAHPEMMPSKLAYCNRLATNEDRRMLGCDRVYAIAEEMLRSRRSGR